MAINYTPLLDRKFSRGPATGDPGTLGDNITGLDTFDSENTPGTELRSHTPDLGFGPWVRHQPFTFTVNLNNGAKFATGAGSSVPILKTTCPKNLKDGGDWEVYCDLYWAYPNGFPRYRMGFAVGLLDTADDVNISGNGHFEWHVDWDFTGNVTSLNPTLPFGAGGSGDGQEDIPFASGILDCTDLPDSVNPGMGVRLGVTKIGTTVTMWWEPYGGGTRTVRWTRIVDGTFIWVNTQNSVGLHYEDNVPRFTNLVFRDLDIVGGDSATSFPLPYTIGDDALFCVIDTLTGTIYRSSELSRPDEDTVTVNGVDLTLSDCIIGLEYTLEARLCTGEGYEPTVEL